MENKEQHHHQSLVKSNQLSTAIIEAKLSSLNINKQQTIPLHGVSFSFLYNAFKLKQEEDFYVVCQQIKEITRNLEETQNRSYANYLKSNNNKVVKDKADVFVSYAWKGSWNETMEALKYHFLNEKDDDVFIWMDLVCLDQHNTTDLDFNDWSKVFQTSLEEIGRAVIAVFPAENPIVATRSWCCFEMSTIVRANIPYEICISPNDTQKLIKAMHSGEIGFDKWNDLFSLVNVERSIATKEADQVAILSLMKEIGVVEVNNIVLNSLKKLYITVTNIAVAESKEDKQLVCVSIAQADLFRALGDYESALPLYKEALKVAQAIPNYDIGTATCLNNLALLLSYQSKFAEAEPLYQQSLAIRKLALGEEHPDVAQSLNNLAGLFSDQGKFDQAIPLYKQSLAIRKNVYGKEHIVVATALNNLALLLTSQGKFGESEPLYREAIAIGEKNHGISHPDVASFLNNLADLLKAQGKFTEAKPLYQQSLAIRRKTLGEEHPDVAQSLNNLALLLSAQGLNGVAKPLFEQSITIFKKALGEDHPNVATLLNNLAALLSGQEEFEEAIPLFEECLAIRKKSYGEEHPSVALALNNLAQLLSNQGKYAEAIPLFEQSIEIQKKFYGEEHPSVATSLSNFAWLLGNQRRYDEAIPLFEQSITIKKKVYGEEHASIARACYSFGLLLSKKGDDVESEKLIRQAIAIGERTLGINNPDVAIWKDNLAVMFKNQRKKLDSSWITSLGY